MSKTTSDSCLTDSEEDFSSLHQRPGAVKGLSPIGHNRLCERKASQALKASDLHPFCFLINNKSKKIAKGCLDPKHACVEVGRTDICQF